MTDRERICCFCGHKDTPYSHYGEIKAEVERQISCGVTEFWSGGTGNFDGMAERAVREANAPGVTLHLILAYKLPAKGDYISLRYDGTIYPHGQESVYPKLAVSRRNRWMCDNAGRMIAYVERSSGGARAMLDYASRHAVEVVNLAGKVGGSS